MVHISNRTLRLDDEEAIGGGPPFAGNAVDGGKCDKVIEERRSNGGKSSAAFLLGPVAGDGDK